MAEFSEQDRERLDDLKLRLYLVKNGIPYSVAMQMGADDLCAYMIAFGELEGGTFDWRLGAWRGPRVNIDVSGSPSAEGVVRAVRRHKPGALVG